jgi:hypothetical protein
MIYRGHRLSRGHMIWLLYHAPPFLVSKLDHATQRKSAKERQVAAGRGEVGEEPNHTTARKPGPLEIIQYSLDTIYLLA